ncbi:unnamed protein product [Closterium sp. NIES-54]
MCTFHCRNPPPPLPPPPPNLLPLHLPLPFLTDLLSLRPSHPCCNFTSNTILQMVGGISMAAETAETETSSGAQTTLPK